MKLDPIFSSNMVFAANTDILIYGSGAGQGQICFAGISKNFYSEGGKWCVEFPPMSYSGPHTLEFRANDCTTFLENIYIGEVYLFAGQSNMEFKMYESSTPQELYQADERLRLFSTDTFEHLDMFKPADGWIVCQEDTIRDWTALGYLAGKALAERKDIAIGIIACYQGSSSITSWMPKDTYQRIGIELTDAEKHPGYFYKEPLAWHFEESMYAFGLSQIFPFPITAAVWYQGEGNTTPKESKVYLQALTEFIGICRRDFSAPTLPFVIVQIADYSTRNDYGWKTVQQAQEQVQHCVPHVKTVISADVCESNNIHPPTKHLLAQRIANALISLK